MGILKNAASKFREKVDTAIADEKKAAAIRKKLNKKEEVNAASGLIKKYKAQGLTQEEAEFMATRDQKKANTVGKIQKVAKDVGGRADKLGTAFDADFGSGPTGAIKGSGKGGVKKKKATGKKASASSASSRLKEAQEQMTGDVGFGNLGTFSPYGTTSSGKGKKGRKPGSVPDPLNDFNF